MLCSRTERKIVPVLRSNYRSCTHPEDHEENDKSAMGWKTDTECPPPHQKQLLSMYTCHLGTQRSYSYHFHIYCHQSLLITANFRNETITMREACMDFPQWLFLKYKINLYQRVIMIGSISFFYYSFKILRILI